MVKCHQQFNMNSKLKISCVILTYNEQIHIERALINALQFFDDVILLDSGSEDKTIEIANSYNVPSFYHKFINYSDQRNFAIQSINVKYDYIFFLDADEYIDDELFKSISYEFNLGNPYDGYYIKRKFIFMGKWIKNGGYYPIYLLRLFNKNNSISIGSINEHISTSGKTKIIPKGNIIDHNLNDISFWITKHNKYSSLEAFEFNNKFTVNYSKIFNSQSNFKSFIKIFFYNKLPILVRPFIYFIYRYFFRFGFLDGYIGFLYHFLQGFIFWFLVDIKIFEIKFKKNGK